MGQLRQYEEMVNRLRASFASGKTKSYEWRISQLMALYIMFEENEDKIIEVISKDLHRHKNETVLLEILMCTNDIADAVNNLKAWMKPEKVTKPSVHILDSAYVHKEPLGIVLNIAPWNYPFQLSFLPIIGAIAAGNCVVLKPSEIAEHSANFMKEYIPKYLDQDCIQVVTGGVPETTALLEEKFDKIFYTGSGAVGKIIMTAAAKHLTPVILELGGKCPVFVDQGVDMNIVAKRLIWGKCCNAGQTCIVPDYVLCPANVQEALINEMKVILEEFFTDDVQKSESYGRIINDRHFVRLQKLKEGATIAVGGQGDKADLFMAPTVLRDVKLSDPVMQEEIFGPLLPIVVVKDHKEAIDIINQRAKALTLYVFSTREEITNDFLHSTSSGSTVVNDVLTQAMVNSLPFGGVGESGFGSYHGKHSFDAFSHHKAIFKRSFFFDQINICRLPPYSNKRLSILQWLVCKQLKKHGNLALPFMIITLLLGLLIMAN